MTGLRALLAVGVVVIVGAAIAAGVMLSGSPVEARLLRLDQRRVTDLQRISRAVDLQWTRTEALPASLDELAVLPGALSMPGDPESGEPYEYRVTGPKTYELCAEFARASVGPARPVDEFWWHPEGRQCFDVTVEEIERGERSRGR